MIARLAMPPANTPLPQNVRAQDAQRQRPDRAGRGAGESTDAVRALRCRPRRRAERRRGDARTAGVRASTGSHLSRSDHHHAWRQARGGPPATHRACRRQHDRAVRRRDRRAVRLGLDHGEAACPLVATWRRRTSWRWSRRWSRSTSSTSSAVTACWARRPTWPANIRYREELRDAVAKAVAAGQTLEQAQASVTMDAYKDWEFYAQQRPRMSPAPTAR